MAISIGDFITEITDSQWLISEIKEIKGSGYWKQNIHALKKSYEYTPNITALITYLTE